MQVPENNMKKAPLIDVREFLKRTFSVRDSSGVFNKLPEGLAKAYSSHYELINTIGLVKEQLEDAADKEIIGRIADNLEANLQDILECISRLTDRTVIQYNTEENDTLWKISKRYTSELNEILKLNHLESIILPTGRTHLLIPLKSTGCK